MRSLSRTPVLQAEHHDPGNGFDCRHLRGVILIRVLVTAWVLALTGILLAYDYSAGHC